MKIKNECITCLARQSVDVAELMTDNKKLQEDIIKKGLEELSTLSFLETSPEIARRLHTYVRELMENPDPYKALKNEYNVIAGDLVESLALEEKVKMSEAPFDTACRLSLAGNIIDFGLGIDLDKEDVQRSINESLTAQIMGSSSSVLKERVNRAKEIMVIADNSGEIVFDKLLIKELPMEKVTYVVKGGPIVNDATMEDAIDVAMTELVRVIDTGYDVQGTIVEKSSKSFRKSFDSADLIIAKGQANYETLSELEDSRIVFLLRAKCKVIADDLSCAQGAFVIKVND